MGLRASADRHQHPLTSRGKQDQGYRKKKRERDKSEPRTKQSTHCDCFVRIGFADRILDMEHDVYRGTGFNPSCLSVYGGAGTRSAGGISGTA